MPHCQECHRVLTKTTYYLPPEKQRARRFCNRECFNATLRTRRLSVVGKKATTLEPPESPHRVPNWYAVPRTCACGGLWRYSDFAVQCRQCGRDLYIVAALPT